MSVINNLNDGDIKDILRRIRTLENRTTLNNSAIGRAGMEVYDGGVLNVSNGTLLVNGLASITGTFRVSGGSTFTGTVGISGPLTVTGPTKLNGQTDIGGNTSVTGDLTVTGPTKLNGQTDIGGDTTVTGDLDVKGPLDVSGTLDIKGKSTLQNDLAVQGGGQIKVGSNMTLNPAKNGGSLDFANGTEVSSTGPNLNLKADNARLLLGTSTATLGGGSSSMTMAGSSTNVTTPLFEVSNRFMASNLAVAPAGSKPNLYCDPATGELKRVV